jgi:hypothetical protein
VLLDQSLASGGRGGWSGGGGRTGSVMSSLFSSSLKVMVFLWYLQGPARFHSLGNENLGKRCDIQ